MSELIEHIVPVGGAGDSPEREWSIAPFPFWLNNEEAVRILVVSEEPTCVKETSQDFEEPSLYSSS